jgi:hypothetical protein
LCFGGRLVGRTPLEVPKRFHRWLAWGLSKD